MQSWRARWRLDWRPGSLPQRRRAGPLSLVSLYWRDVIAPTGGMGTETVDRDEGPFACAVEKRPFCHMDRNEKIV